MFTAYLDESGDPGGRRGGFGVAGSLSTIQKWLRLDEQWRGILKHHGVDVFHMQECAAGTGEYKGWSTDHRRSLIYDLSECMARHVKHAFAVTVVLEGWSRVNEEFRLAHWFGHPYAFCGRLAVQCVGSWMKSHKLSVPVDYVFEDGTKGKGKGELVDLISGRDGFTPRFKPKSWPPLQAADLIVWKNRRVVHDLLEHPYTMTAAQLKRSLAPVSRIPRKFWVLGEGELHDFCIRHNVPQT